MIWICRILCYLRQSAFLILLNLREILFSELNLLRWLQMFPQIFADKMRRFKRIWICRILCYLRQSAFLILLNLREILLSELNLLRWLQMFPQIFADKMRRFKRISTCRILCYLRQSAFLILLNLREITGTNLKQLSSLPGIILFQMFIRSFCYLTTTRSAHDITLLN